jgi:hypothetical protein
MAVATVTNNTYQLEVVHDEDAISPRNDRDNFGTMVCFHKRYSLGDEHSYSEPIDFLMSLLEEKLGDTDLAEEKYNELCNEIDIKDFGKSYGSYKKAIDDNVLKYLSDSYLILPLYLYDHSGITINTTGFSCPWDSGQIGWSFVSNDKIKEEYGIINNETLARAENVLKAEIKDYDYYISGECYGYRLLGNGDEMFSCYNYLGDFNDVKERIKEDLPDEFSNMADALEYDEEIDLEEHELD